MIWPFKDSNDSKKRINRLSEEVGQARNSMYSKLFELDRVDHALDTMVKQSLSILKTGRPDEPTDS